MCDTALRSGGVGWPPRAWAEARQARGYKSLSICREDVAKGRELVERTLQEPVAGCDAWSRAQCALVLRRSSLLNQVVWWSLAAPAYPCLPGCTFVSDRQLHLLGGGCRPLWDSEALETGRTGSAELTALCKTGWFMC